MINGPSRPSIPGPAGLGPGWDAAHSLEVPVSALQRVPRTGAVLNIVPRLGESGSGGRSRRSIVDSPVGTGEMRPPGVAKTRIAPGGLASEPVGDSAGLPAKASRTRAIRR
ncbi:hypothetical protein Atai01_27190 [Amycolatopsis taiwanensis]|uniref:Uncharacterized protein n=1 Tax=Amycolatopsis taiwanensis TaxID=342230 RepID=A0A9W6R219_9PSEU|nr:hypothetical protein Atai01_27190 [Amycolatopsis taiwanensis]